MKMGLSQRIGALCLVATSAISRADTITSASRLDVAGMLSIIEEDLKSGKCEISGMVLTMNALTAAGLTVASIQLEKPSTSDSRYSREFTLVLSDGSSRTHYLCK
jgi:hypothetical protein